MFGITVQVNLRWKGMSEALAKEAEHFGVKLTHGGKP